MRTPIAALFLSTTLLLPAAPVAAQANGTVACDARILRIVENLRHEPMTPDQAERARNALYAAVEKCRPLPRGSSSYGAMTAPAGRDSGDTRKPDTQLERQSLRAQQNVLSPSELREGERRLDSIERKAQTDPGAARDMQRIWEADRSLSTINRPIPGGSDNPSLVGPSLVGPGDRN